MKNKKPLQGVLCLLSIILCVSILFVSVSAADTTNALVNYDDYATYSLSQTAGIWNVKAAFPGDWASSFAELVSDSGTSFIGRQQGSLHRYLYPSAGGANPRLRLRVSPLGNETLDSLAPGMNYTDLRLLDSSLVPETAQLEFSFDIVVSSEDNKLGNLGDITIDEIGDIRFCVVYMKQNANDENYYEVVTSDDWFAQFSYNENTATVSIETRFNLADYPEHYGSPFVPLVEFTDFTGASWNSRLHAYDITFLYREFNIMFQVTDAVKIANDSARGEKLLNNIEQALADQGKQLDDFLNNDIELDQGEVGGAVGDLDSAEDALLDKVGGYLGEASSLFSSIISDLTQFAPAFAAVALVFNEFVSIPFIGFLLRISIMLGILAVALNMSISAERAGYWAKGKKAEEHRKNNPIGFKYDK